MKSLFTPSLFDLSLSYLFISNPSLCKPSFSSPWSFWLLKQKEWLLAICFADFKRAGQKVEGILLFVPLRRFYAVLFVLLFCRPRDKCGTLWKTIWLHNVHNIRQKDIKSFANIPAVIGQFLVGTDQGKDVSLFRYRLLLFRCHCFCSCTGWSWTCTSYSC